jgi:hypothetical protein
MIDEKDQTRWKNTIKERIHKNSTTYFAHKHVFGFFQIIRNSLYFILSDKKDQI